MRVLVTGSGLRGGPKLLCRLISPATLENLNLVYPGVSYPKMDRQRTRST